MQIEDSVRAELNFKTSSQNVQQTTKRLSKVLNNGLNEKATLGYNRQHTKIVFTISYNLASGRLINEYNTKFPKEHSRNCGKQMRMQLRLSLIITTNLVSKKGKRSVHSHSEFYHFKLLSMAKIQIKVVETDTNAEKLDKGYH